MKPRTIQLIVNPISGTKPKDVIVPKIEARLAEAGFDVRTVYTQGRGDATRLAREAIDNKYFAVAVCGGDGTVNETARALCDTNMPMGIIPAGSGNGLARHIGLPSDPVAALGAITSLNIRDCDYADANGAKFFCTFGLGFDAAVTRNFSERGKRGFSTYIRSAIYEFSHYKPKEYILEIDDQLYEVKAYVIACCNASQYGNNAYIAPEASITDGVLDIVILKDASHLKTLFAGLDMLTGLLPYNRQVDIIRTDRVKIHQKTLGPAHIDGEVAEMPLDVEVNIHKGCLRLFADPGKKTFTPFITPINYIRRDMGIAISNIFKH